MSSSEHRLQATPWSLDEFSAFDMFAVPPDAHDPAPADAIDDAAEIAYEARFSAEAVRIEADAYARGRADGERAARESLDILLASGRQVLEEAAQSVRLHEARWVSNAEENISALAVIVARHIVQCELTTDPSIVIDLVRQALDQYPVDQEITVRVHPDDLAACRGALSGGYPTPSASVSSVTTPSTGGGAVPRALRWIADASIMRGGCLTEGRERIIDGRVDTALERAYRNLAIVQAS